MALRIYPDKPQTDAPDSDYVYGKIRDDDGTGIYGTPVNTEVYGDMHQFFARIMDKANITPNGLPDNDYSGWQLYDSLIQLIINNAPRSSDTDFSSF